MGAVPFQLAMGAVQYKAQGEIGKINQGINERNALILEGQAEQIEKKAEFDIAQFEKNFTKIIISARRFFCRPLIFVRRHVWEDVKNFPKNTGRQS